MQMFDVNKICERKLKSKQKVIKIPIKIPIIQKPQEYP